MLVKDDLSPCCRSASFSQSTRHNSNVFMGSDSAVQKLSHGFSHCLNGMGGQLHGFYSLPKPGKHQLPVQDDSPQEACYVLPRGYSSEAPVHSNLSEPELENEELYTFQTPCNMLATMHNNERPTDNYDLPTPPGSIHLSDPSDVWQESQCLNAVQLWVVLCSSSQAP